MRGISIKAILIGNVASVATALLLAVAAFALIFLATVFLVLIEGSSASLIRGVFGDALVAIVVASPALGGGYVAGRIAQDRFVLHGILGAALWTLLLVAPIHIHIPAPHSSSEPAKLPAALSFVLTYGGPLFGMIGGCLARLRLDWLAGLPIDERPSLKSSLFAAGRFALATAAALLAYLASLALSLAVVANPFGFVFAVAAGISAGTAVVSRQQRKTAAIAFMTIAVLIPIEELVRHMVAGDAAHMQAFFVSLNAMGAGMAYLALLRMFPEEISVPSGRWWWLSTRDYAAWSFIERSVRLGLALTGGIMALLLFAVIAEFLQLVGTDAHYAAPAAGIIGVPLGLRSARSIYSKLYPRDLERADIMASTRLGLTA
jgi:hypothetical protein